MLRLSSTRLRAIFILVGFFGAVFIGIQFIRPTLDNPPVLADLQAPPEVKQILMTSCYNCPSNETKMAAQDPAAEQPHIDAITGMRASVIP